MVMEIKFWGVRGSIACSGPGYNKYGGHTSCVSVQLNDDLIIFDAGTGLNDLGLTLSAKKISKATLCLSHGHFDHIIGLPFFQPLWDPEFELNIVTDDSHFTMGTKAFFEDHLFHPTLFPVCFSELSAKIKLYSIDAIKHLDIGQKITLDSITLQHPGGATGYRIDSRGKSVCYITDHEHHNTEIQEKLIPFVSGADLLIYDSTFTIEEYNSHIGWGHSTWQQGIKLCQQANIKQLALFHHNHLHTDDIMSDIEDKAQAEWFNVFAARQGMTLLI